ncbi:hypothetical protein [Parabacteroides merdae]|uniref:Uncharacterized protein n=1 Tax=Parabacteroides merdae TaxID=46503 RepID=A0A9Q4RDD0_9BACT|nr:hypothetical protein [Parabacteroides merdae]MBT9637365.1 hypothetical protein [Parabacteroides merdae]MCB6303919.1 hypothetical protein [Parabacteroides merdae]MCG4934882.1 hypothetical protein [Parabacteroides merdae]MCQ5220070.1 hypothetical protein [Parabacteroides merdae]MDB8886038.1 hypothetical protein [Parabacteroides merdae]
MRCAEIYRDDRLCCRELPWFMGNDDRLRGDEVPCYGDDDRLCGDKR